MFNKTVSGTLIIAGTAIGAGMLGIPLVTSEAGFIPALGITTLVWLFMLATGFLFLEATLWMHGGANVLSMAERFLGQGGKWLSGAVYIFLYYCLMVAYFAAGAPLVSPTLLGYTGYGLVFGAIVVLGIKAVDRINYILMIAMFAAYFGLIGVGMPQIVHERLITQDFSKVLFAAPILFSAFGYHNVIPSLTDYFKRDVRVLRRSIFWGTFITFIVYLLWQWLIIGVVPQSAINEALQRGQPATAALHALTGSLWVVRFGQCFAFFAIVTSMLGVAFSLVDFIADGLKIKAQKLSTRAILTTVVFLPPYILSLLDPTIFVTAIGFAGGFGEAFLNGLLPVMLVWIGRYKMKLQGREQLAGNKAILIALFAAGLFVMLLEGVFQWIE